MENKIHWRKITSSTEEKNDGQRAGTREKIVLAVRSPVVIAPSHLQEKEKHSLLKRSHLAQGAQQL